jgi:hypothetical protein
MYLFTRTHAHTQYVCTAHTARPQQGCPAVFLPVLAGRYTIEVNSIRSERAHEGIHMHIYEAIFSYIFVCVCVCVCV